MTFEIDINGRTRTVAIEKTVGGKYRVSLDGQLHEINAARVGVYGLSLLDGQAGISREVQVTPGTTRGELLVSLSGRTIAATVNGRRTGRAGVDAGGGDGEQTVVAPMPGRVVRVLVAAGDEVAVRQGVVVVEAMKMENELRAPRAGKVKEINVTPGTLVEAGRVLLVIE
ncbi:MAG: acetyl-CoA carboxylase biotin carboxyl carrier protein subunit [Acidobacteria bacterium]|nr:acetyl-CoA carboxylase biotin carboxyl carrier protein subunit [Acidobacteriota bacterium]